MIHPAMPRLPHWPNPMLGPTQSALPVGTIIAFGGQIAEAGAGTAAGPHVTMNIEAWGWMPCDGRQLSGEIYQELYACIGNLYGGTAPAFLLPDLRGYFLRGADADGHNDPDAALRVDAAGMPNAGVGSRQDDALRNHVHLEVPGGVPSPVGPVMAPVGIGAVGPAIASATPVPTEAGVRFSAHETRPKNISVHYLIRFTNRLSLG